MVNEECRGCKYSYTDYDVVRGYGGDDVVTDGWQCCSAPQNEDEYKLRWHNCPWKEKVASDDGGRRWQR